MAFAYCEIVEEWLKAPIAEQNKYTNMIFGGKEAAPDLDEALGSRISVLTYSFRC